MVPETRRHYYPDGMARRAGSQIPAGAEIAVVKFLPKRCAIIKYGGRRCITSSIYCRKIVPVHDLKRKKVSTEKNKFQHPPSPAILYIFMKRFNESR
jgi:hypothetical protein